MKFPITLICCQGSHCRREIDPALRLGFNKTAFQWQLAVCKAYLQLAIDLLPFVNVSCQLRPQWKVLGMLLSVISGVEVW
jgi:hypothetical protein